MALSAPIPAPQGVEVWTVTQLTRRVKGLLESEVGTIWVSGEISNWRVSPAGHAYFTLKDDKSQLAAVMFKGRLSALRFEPESGLEVIAHGLVTVYEQRGQYQIICEELHPKGMGALQLAFEKLKAKLEEEGLFDEAHKKPLPMLPTRIGIVTSPTGAAIRDMLHVMGRRFAHLHIILYPARVQGAEAAPEIVEGIRYLDNYGVDVIIIGRGGGSLEDLWAFNEEAVVRAVYEAATPIISAVGHEIDFALSDFAADVRAPTPSAAAEIVVKEHEVLVDNVSRLKQSLIDALSLQLERLQHRLYKAKSCYVFQRPEELVRQYRQRADEARMGLERGIVQFFDVHRHRLAHAFRALGLLAPANQVRRAHERLLGTRLRLLEAGRGIVPRKRAAFQPLVAQLDALSPVAILARGYALAWKLPEQSLVRDARDLKPEDRLKLRFGRGEAEVVVEDTQSDDEKDDKSA